MPQTSEQQNNGRASREQQSAAERTEISILRYILDHPSSTRRDTAQGLRLSFPNVCRLVAGFQEQGTVVEDHLKQTGKRGPRSKTLSLKADLGCTIGVDLESTHVRGIILDFSNEICGVFRKPITADASGDRVVSSVAEAAVSLVHTAREQSLHVSAVGLALPGPVIDQANGRVRTELQGGRAEMEFVPTVREACGVDTYATANDICFALGHHRLRHSDEDTTDLLVLNRFGLSAAMVRGGDLYSGHLGLLPYGTGRPIRHYRDVCTGSAILRQARSGNDGRSFQELISSPEDPLVSKWLATAIPAFAQAVFSAALMYSPDRLIIEGIFNNLSKDVRTEMIGTVEEEIARLGMPAPEVSFFEGDDLMGARGAAFIARDQIADDLITDIVRAGRDSHDR